MEQEIVADEKIQQEEPGISGTRSQVDLILDRLAEGMTYEEIMKEYTIEKEDILTILDFASQHFSSIKIFC
ncbi:MAG: DUF433 domain-containing protein [Thermodesulfovibrionales bacterium]